MPQEAGFHSIAWGSGVTSPTHPPRSLVAWPHSPPPVQLLMLRTVMAANDGDGVGQAAMLPVGASILA